MTHISTRKARSEKPPTLTGVWEVFVSEYLGELAPSTQTSYRKAARKFPSAGKTIDKYEAADVRKIIKDLPPGAYMVTRSLISRLMTFSVEKGWRSTNPVEFVPTKKLGSFKRWPEDRLQAALQAVPGDEGLALELMYATAQRLSDVERSGPANLKPIYDHEGLLTGGIFTITQQKTGNLVSVPISAFLTQKLLSNGNKRRYVNTPRHKIYRVWNRVRVAFGMEDFKPHGLRKSGSCEAAEGGATEAELQALLGHRTARAATIYRAEADQGLLAAAAMGKRIMANVITHEHQQGVTK